MLPRVTADEISPRELSIIKALPSQVHKKLYVVCPYAVELGRYRRSLLASYQPPALSIIQMPSCLLEKQLSLVAKES